MTGFCSECHCYLSSCFCGHTGVSHGYYCLMIMLFTCIVGLINGSMLEWLQMGPIGLMTMHYLTAGLRYNLTDDISQVRRAIGDFGVPISIMVMAFVAFLIPHTFIQVHILLHINIAGLCYVLLLASLLTIKRKRLLVHVCRLSHLSVCLESVLWQNG